MISIVIISKDESDLDDTLADVTSEINSFSEPCEIVVVDASSGRLDCIRRRHEAVVRWVDFKQPPGVLVSIPHQRNVGVREARGEIIVFTDAGCRPRPGWLSRLVTPLFEGEDVATGTCKDASGERRYEGRYEFRRERYGRVTYLNEAGTNNLALVREVFDKVGGFDENLQYGGDMDFSWRLVDIGFRIRSVPDAIVEHDWGTARRQRRRSYMYGKARARLYRKHRSRLKKVLRNDPMVVLNPLFLLGLPITLVFPLYPLLLLIPAWWNRHRGVVGAGRAVVDHLCYGAGVLQEIAISRVDVRQSQLGGGR